jgi:signal transduction histidine kinase
MNRMWIRLSLTFTVVILASMLLLGFITSQFISNGLPLDIITAELRSTNGLATQLEAWYAENGSWEGVDDYLAAQNMFIPRGINQSPVHVIFTDAYSRVLYTGYGDTASAMEAVVNTPPENTIRLTVDGETVGRLYVAPVILPQVPGEQPVDFARPLLAGFVLVFIVAGLVSLVAGVIVSRQLTRPLNRLAATARSLRSSSLSARADVGGTNERRDMALAFNEMAAGLEEAERLRRGMVSDVAHELRTPLTVLHANLQAILDDVYPLNKDEIVVLQEQVTLLQTLANDLHLLAQADARRLPMRAQETDLNALVERALSPFEAVAQRQGVTLRRHLPAQPVTITADPDRLVQVLNNLVQNALTHTPSGGSVTVSAESQNGQAVLRVADTGSGIPPADQKYVFDRFYRADSSRDRESGGAGLGLAIVKAIVELQGGRVSVESAGVPLLGSTFTVTLPLRAGAVPAG